MQQVGGVRFRYRAKSKTTATELELSGLSASHPEPEGPSVNYAIKLTSPKTRCYTPLPHDVDLMKRDHWPGHFGWLQERCESFVQVLRPRAL